MKRPLAVGAALGVALILSACGNPHVTGTVNDKHFTPAHTDTIMVPQYTTTCTTVNQVTSCTQRLLYFLPVESFVPDDYDLQVRDEDSQKLKWVDVSKEVYDSEAVGDFFSNKKSDADS
jgi:hypothetical protein